MPTEMTQSDQEKEIAQMECCAIDELKTSWKLESVLCAGKLAA
jgi:hypothetical protein